MENFCRTNNILHKIIPQYHSPRASFTAYLYGMLKILKPILPIKEEDIQESINELFKLRNKIAIEKDSEIEDERILKTFKRTPKDVRAEAVFEAVKAHNLSISSKKIFGDEYKQLYKLIVKIEKKKKQFDEKAKKAIRMQMLKDNLKASVEQMKNQIQEKEEKKKQKNMAQFNIEMLLKKGVRKEYIDNKH